MEEAHHTPHVVVIMPAYNAAKTLERTYRDIPADVVHQVILVDDVSQDETVQVSKQLGIVTIVHIQNRGYGGNQKTCYWEALKIGADVIIMLHPDHQYDATKIPELIEPILKGRADLVLGSRFLEDRALAGGMPVWKYVANRGLTALENVAFQKNLSEYHTGFRAYSRRMLLTIPFLLNSDDFVFDSQVIAQAVAFGFTIAEIAVETRYFKEASSVNFKRSLVYGVQTVRTVAEFLLDRANIRRSRRFRITLSKIVSQHYHEELFGGGSSARADSSLVSPGDHDHRGTTA